MLRNSHSETSASSPRLPKTTSSAFGALTPAPKLSVRRPKWGITALSLPPSMSSFLSSGSIERVCERVCID